MNFFLNYTKYFLSWKWYFLNFWRKCWLSLNSLRESRAEQSKAIEATGIVMGEKAYCIETNSNSIPLLFLKRQHILELESSSRWALGDSSVVIRNRKSSSNLMVTGCVRHEWKMSGLTNYWTTLFWFYDLSVVVYCVNCTLLFEQCFPCKRCGFYTLKYSMFCYIHAEW